MSRKAQGILYVIIIWSSIAFSQNPSLNIVYKRSSLHTIMLSEDDRLHNSTIEAIFTSRSIPEKFNDHTIDVKTISINDLEKTHNTKKKKKGILGSISLKSSKKESLESQHKSILRYFENKDFAKSLISKWFNRSPSGAFNMDLIAKRGLYNATDLDIKIAKNTERGLAILSDAGEELIKNTFIVVNDFNYINKEEVLKEAKGILGSISSVASKHGKNTVAQVLDATSAGAEVFGKGYVVKTRAFLYRLKWDEEIAAIFYNDLWNDQDTLDKDRVKAFDNSELFTLEYIGSETSWADIQSTIFTTKSNKELIAIATIKATDNVLAMLQKKYEVFRTKTPLLSGDPISAKIGLKEGLDKNSKYEVLEQSLNKNGIIEYKRVGVIKTEENKIWDNRYMADEENFSELTYTTFKTKGLIKKAFYSGMLIRQIN